MFEMQAHFTGSFDQDCQVKSVPQSLLALVNIFTMVLVSTHRGCHKQPRVQHNYYNIIVLFVDERKVLEHTITNQEKHPFPDSQCMQEHKKVT